MRECCWNLAVDDDDDDDNDDDDGDETEDMVECSVSDEVEYWESRYAAGCTAKDDE